MIQISQYDERKTIKILLITPTDQKSSRFCHSGFQLLPNDYCSPKTHLSLWLLRTRKSNCYSYRKRCHRFEEKVNSATTITERLPLQGEVVKFAFKFNATVRRTEKDDDDKWFSYAISDDIVLFFFVFCTMNSWRNKSLWKRAKVVERNLKTT